MMETNLPRHFESPEAAYFGFFRADRARDKEAWAAVNSYPHVRITPTTRLEGMDAKSTSFFVETPEEYAAEADWTSREATGWVETIGREPVRFHESSRKVHLLGGWTRYDKNGKPIRSNRVAYIMTKPQDSWGIQARFSVQAFEGPRDLVGDNCANIIEQFIEAAKQGDYVNRLKLCRFPFIIVDVGHVSIIKNDLEMQQYWEKDQNRKIKASVTQSLQTSSSGAIVSSAVAFDDGEKQSHLYLVGKLDDHWSIAGVSSIL